MSETRALIRVKSLYKRFGNRTAVDGVSFDLHPGESIALVGPNGAGKTTLLRCILGLTSYEGSVSVSGYSPLQEGLAVRKLVGYVPQRIPGLREPVCELVGTVAFLRDVPWDDLRSQMDRLGLSDVWNVPFSDLSGGMQQKLVLTVALAGDPPILILDEPTASLDQKSRELVLDSLADLRDGGKAIVFASHRDADIRRLATRTILLEEGRVVEDLLVQPPRTDRGPSTLQIDVPAENRLVALEVLTSHEFQATIEDDRLIVRGLVSDRTAPLLALFRAGVPVSDFAIPTDRETCESD